MSSACQCHIEGAFCFYCEVYSPVVWQAARLMEENEDLNVALREIDTHICATSDPIPHIVATLKRVLPEYSEEVGGFEDVRGCLYCRV